MNERNESSFAGMTVNERLVQAGIPDKWDRAVRRRDRDAMIALLEQVEVAEPQVTVDAVLSNPERFGF